jgi:regulator of protease activity HflC (stomatin/prohibitin superfamily)
MTEQPSPGGTDSPARSGSRIDIHERPAVSVNGWFGVALLVICVLVAHQILRGTNQGWVAVPVIVFVVVVLSLAVVQPGQARAVQFFGRYIGTVRRTGLTWILPLTIQRRVSLRVRNFETGRLKVNDANGNPIEIAAIVVWQVTDTSKALYAVEDYTNFVTVQAESALRHVATAHPYDNAVNDGTTLRGSTDTVAGELAAEVAQRVDLAGVEIVEVRISHLAYAQEIAQAMLRRQQADAVVAARSRIVEGAVGMVESALAQLSEHDIVTLDEERKAAMVSNLMVVLCGDQPASPIVNAGSLYT